MAQVVADRYPAQRRYARRGRCVRLRGLAGQHRQGGGRPRGRRRPPFPPPARPRSVFYHHDSSLAHLLPYMENQSVRELLDLSLPLYMPGAGYPVADRNKAGVAQVIPEFLCPSDLTQPVKTDWGPTNYVACAGSGAGGGTPFE